MRIFIAVKVESSQIDKIKREFDIKGLRITKENHITLKFLGDVSERKLEDIKEKLKGLKFKPFKAQKTGLGCFPAKGDIKVIWIGVDSNGIREIHKNIIDVFGVSSKDEKDFSPHVTLARVKYLEDKKMIRNKLKMKIEEEYFFVDNIILVKSELTKEGPVYTVLETYNAD